MRPTIDSRTPRRSAGHRVGIEARAAVAHEHLDALRRRPRRRRETGSGPANLAALTSASRAAATSASAPRVERAVADRHDVDRDAVVLLDLGGGELERRRERAALAQRAAAVEPRAQLALLAAGERRRPRAGSSARRWISASVCSTESCRCAASSARSCERMRSARSSASPRTSRSHHGARISASRDEHDHDRQQHVARRLQRVVELEEEQRRRRRPARPRARRGRARRGGSRGAPARLRGAGRGSAGRRRVRPLADWRQISAPPRGRQHDRPHQRVADPQAPLAEAAAAARARAARCRPRPSTSRAARQGRRARRRAPLALGGHRDPRRAGTARCRARRPRRRRRRRPAG